MNLDRVGSGRDLPNEFDVIGATVGWLVQLSVGGTTLLAILAAPRLARAFPGRSLVGLLLVLFLLRRCLLRHLYPLYVQLFAIRLEHPHLAAAVKFLDTDSVGLLRRRIEQRHI